MRYKLRPDSIATAALLTALITLGPFSTDTYLPSLPAMTHYFAASVGDVQLTLSVFFFAFAFFQLAAGPLSDRFGRRPVLIGGMVLYIFTSLACIFAPTIEWLTTARFFQGIGVASGAVLARAVVRDVYEPSEGARVLSYMATAMAVAPMVAPLFGGFLIIWFDWRAVFVFMTGIGIALLVLVAVLLQETNAFKNPEATNVKRLFGNYGILLSSPLYLGYVATAGFGFGGFFAFISGSSFVIIDFFGLDPRAYGLAFGLVVVGFMIGTVVSGRLSMRLGINRMLLFGASSALTGGALLAGLAWAGVDHLAAVLAPMMLYSFGGGLSMPNSTAGALAPFPRMAGAAASMMGFLQMGFAAFIGFLVGQLDDGTQIPMVSIIGCMGLGAFLSFYFLVWRAERSD